MKKNPYMQYNYQMLKALEQRLIADLKDSTLTHKAKANSKSHLDKVREAMKSK